MPPVASTTARGGMVTGRPAAPPRDAPAGRRREPSCADQALGDFAFEHGDGGGDERTAATRACHDGRTGHVPANPHDPALGMSGLAGDCTRWPSRSRSNGTP